VRYIFREIYGWCVNNKISKGNFIDWHNLRGKIHILQLADKYFTIPKTLVTLKGHDTKNLRGYALVAKSLSSEVSSENTVMPTSEIILDSIDPSYPWYLQTKICSDWDVTIFQCGDDLFAFKRSRENLKGVDWRSEQTLDYSVKEWYPLDLSKSNKDNIFKLRFGRSHP
jgi:hypothetical protein